MLLFSPRQQPRQVRIQQQRSGPTTSQRSAVATVTQHTAAGQLLAGRRVVAFSTRRGDAARRAAHGAGGQGQLVAFALANHPLPLARQLANSAWSLQRLHARPSIELKAHIH